MSLTPKSTTPSRSEGTRKTVKRRHSQSDSGNNEVGHKVKKTGASTSAPRVSSTIPIRSEGKRKASKRGHDYSVVDGSVDNANNPVATKIIKVIPQQDTMKKVAIMGPDNEKMYKWRVVTPDKTLMNSSDKEPHIKIKLRQVPKTPTIAKRSNTLAKLQLIRKARSTKKKHIDKKTKIIGKT